MIWWFYKVNDVLIRRVREVFKYFYEVFGLDVNYEKFYIYFGGVKEDVKEKFIELF